VRLLQVRGPSISGAAWLSDFVAATTRNLERADTVRMRPVVDVVARTTSLRTLRRELSRAVRRAMPYVFKGPLDHVIVSLDDAHDRAWGACGDGAAVAAAALLAASARGFDDVVIGGRRQRRRPQLCYETVEGVSRYAHARVMLQGEAVEPWPEVRRPEANGCTLLFDIVDDSG
jgi:hypothetical protein